MRACIPHGAVNAHVHVHEGSCSQNVKQIIYNMRIQHGMQSKHPDAGRLLTVYILSRSSTEQNTSSCKHTTLRCGSRKVSFFSFFFQLFCCSFWEKCKCLWFSEIWSLFAAAFQHKWTFSRSFVWSVQRLFSFKSHLLYNYLHATPRYYITQ